MQPVITSLLDTDLYKFTMWQALLHRHPQTQSEYRFVCRNQPIYPLAELLPEVNAALDHLCTLRFREDELAYLGGLRFIKSDFIDFLRIFQFQRSFIRAWAEGDQLHIVAQGPQVHVMGFEIFVLAIVNELYFRRFDATAALASGRERLAVKVQQLQDLAQQTTLRHPFELFDFGLRRRYSGAWQREVVQTFATQAPQWFTSLVRFVVHSPLPHVAHGAGQSRDTHSFCASGALASGWNSGPSAPSGSSTDRAQEDCIRRTMQAARQTAARRTST